MNVRYNLKEKSLIWTFLTLFPLSCNTFFLLPFTLPRLVVIDGIPLVDTEVLERVLEQGKEIEFDLRFFYEAWSRRGSPNLGGLTNQAIDFRTFENSLEVLGILISKVRAR